MSEKETMKSEIIKYAMSKIGTKRVSTLDGMTLEYKNKCYNIYVDDNNVTVEELEDLDEYEDIIENEDFDEFIENENLEEYGEISDRKESTKMYNDKCFCCPADRKGNECKGRETCGKTWKRYETITNPEWHHVSLATLTNINFGMLDEKRQLYLSLYREIKELIKDLHKCRSGRTYEKRLAKMYSRNAELVGENKITSDYIRYIIKKVSMCNVDCGLWTSATEESTGYHKSRRYNQLTMRY